MSTLLRLALIVAACSPALASAQSLHMHVDAATATVTAAPTTKAVTSAPASATAATTQAATSTVAPTAVSYSNSVINGTAQTVTTAATCTYAAPNAYLDSDINTITVQEWNPSLYSQANPNTCPTSKSASDLYSSTTVALTSQCTNATNITNAAATPLLSVSYVNAGCPFQASLVLSANCGNYNTSANLPMYPPQYARDFDLSKGTQCLGRWTQIGSQYHYYVLVLPQAATGSNTSSSTSKVQSGASSVYASSSVYLMGTMLIAALATMII